MSSKSRRRKRPPADFGDLTEVPTDALLWSIDAAQVEYAALIAPVMVELARRGVDTFPEDREEEEVRQ